VLTTAKRVLIAEDHPAMREGLQRVVERDGDMIVIASAADGLQAVQLHLQLQPDVTLMDLQMPKLDGLGAVAAIREISPSSRFVVLTSYAGHARVRRALDYGASSFCTISRIGPARFRVNGPTLHGLPAEPRFESSTRPFSLRQVFWL
jgi:DNA-binding NarL/FixJ family response regulator